MEIKILPDYRTLSTTVSELISTYIHHHKNALICFASGHTPIGVFQELAKEVNNKNLDLSDCTFLSLDEWIGIDPTDPGSCLSMLKKDCFEPLHIQPDKIEFFNVQADNMQKECDRINSLIEEHGGLDIMLVGVGTNGHIGMNEPGTSFNSLAHSGFLAEETINVGQKYFNQPTALSQGITLGLRHLREAKLPIIMASGEKKAAIMAKGLTQSPTEDTPVSIAQLIKQGYVMLDQEAGKLLS